MQARRVAVKTMDVGERRIFVGIDRERGFERAPLVRGAPTDLDRSADVREGAAPACRLFEPALFIVRIETRSATGMPATSAATRALIHVLAVPPNDLGTCAANGTANFSMFRVASAGKRNRSSPLGS
jgi:hypothetical protein